MVTPSRLSFIAAESACRWCAHRSDLADQLLAFALAPEPDRERMVHDARRALATAGLQRAVMREMQEATALEALPDLPQEMAAVHERIVDGAEILLGLRAARSAVGFLV